MQVLRSRLHVLIPEEQGGDRVVLEGGVHLAKDEGGRWYCTQAGAPESWPNLETAAQALGLSPVLAVNAVSGDTDRYMLQIPPGEAKLEMPPTEWYTRIELFWYRAQLDYITGLIEHHLVSMTIGHAELAARLAATAQHPEWEGDTAGMSQQTAFVYYELDALLAGIQRGYDTLGILSWAAWDARAKKVEKIDHALERSFVMPNNLRERLRDSWSRFGERVKAYRNCIMHHTPIDRGVTNVFFERLLGVWTASARLPDNPAVKKKSAFTYKDRIDALSYGWRAGYEFLRAASLVQCQLAGADVLRQRPE